MSSSKLVLYDLPSKGNCACWSLNPWKVRLALNFKGIDYETSWVEYPDIEPKLKPLVTANDSSHNPIPYSIPTVQFPSSDHVMDSKAIVTRLEKEHPSPSLHLESQVLKDVERLVPKQQEALRGVWMPEIPAKLLNQESAEYFEATRSKKFGMPLEELKKQTGGEEAWMEALPSLRELGEVLTAKDGPFCMGDTPSYADFVIVSWIHFLRRIDLSFYTKIIEMEPSYKVVYDACKPWLERDGH